MAVTTGPLLGVFDTEQARLIGITQNGGTPDITYFAGQDTPTPAGAVPVVAETNLVTEGNRFIESLVRQLDGIISGEIVRDANGAAVSASVIFPDGTTGTYTALVLSTASPGAVDSYAVTYGTQTYMQPTVTRDASGAVTNRPAITVE